MRLVGSVYRQLRRGLCDWLFSASESLIIVCTLSLPIIICHLPFVRFASLVRDADKILLLLFSYYYYYYYYSFAVCAIRLLGPRPLSSGRGVPCRRGVGLRVRAAAGR